MVEYILMVLASLGVVCLLWAIIGYKYVLTFTGRTKHLIRRYAGQQPWMKEKGKIKDPVVFWQPIGSEKVRCDTWNDFLPFLHTALSPEYWLVKAEIVHKGSSTTCLTICHLSGHPFWRIECYLFSHGLVVINLADRQNHDINTKELPEYEACEIALQLCRGFSCAYELLYDMVLEVSIDTTKKMQDATQSPVLEQYRQLLEISPRALMGEISFPNREFGKKL